MNDWAQLSHSVDAEQQVVYPPFYFSRFMFLLKHTSASNPHISSFLFKDCLYENERIVPSSILFVVIIHQLTADLRSSSWWEGVFFSGSSFNDGERTCGVLMCRRAFGTKTGGCSHSPFFTPAKHQKPLQLEMAWLKTWCQTNGLFYNQSMCMLLFVVFGCIKISQLKISANTGSQTNTRAFFFS